MSADRDAQFRRLLRWFPQGWRDQWEDVALGSLADDADRRHLSAPTRGDAWALRAHGVVERLATAAQAVAFVALATSAVGAVTFILAPQAPVVASIGSICGMLLGPVLIVAAAVGLSYRAGLLSVRAALASALLGALALAVAYVARLSWSLDFDDADAGRPQSWFAAAFLQFAVIALVLGTAALLPLGAGILHQVPWRVLRLLLSALIAAFGAASVGIALIVPTSAALAAAALVIALVVATQRRRPSLASPDAQERTLPEAGRVWSRSRRNALALATGAAGSASVLFAMTGSGWAWYGGDGTEAMNLGLALACLSAIPLLAAVGNLLRSRRRYRRSLAPVAMLGSLLVMAGGQAVGPGNSLQQTLLLIAVAFAALAVALLALPVLPGSRFARSALTIGLAAAAFATVGLPLAVLAPIAAPLAAVLLLVLTALRDRSTKRLATPASG